MRWLVTGGAGFIGSALIRQLLAEESSAVVINADHLTYAGHDLASLLGCERVREGSYGGKRLGVKQ